MLAVIIGEEICLKLTRSHLSLIFSPGLSFQSRLAANSFERRRYSARRKSQQSDQRRSVQSGFGTQAFFISIFCFIFGICSIKLAGLSFSRF